MTWLLRHNFWMVKLFGLVTVMALVANTASTLLAFYLVSSAVPTPRHVEKEDDDDDDAESDEVVAAAVAVNSRARQAERAAEIILGYNPMCPTCGPESPVESEVVDGPIDGPASLDGARRSQLPLVVAATMEHEDPELSLATLVDVEHGIGGLFGVGDTLDEQVSIVHVAAGVVHIQNHGQLEYIPFTGAEPVAPKPAATPEKEPKGKSKDRSIPGAQEAIQCTDKGDCVVDRQFVDKLMKDPKLLVGQGGASPTQTKDGSPGFKLRGVRRGTLPQLLGLKNGDVITEVGGTPLTMDALAGLATKLRHASHIEVTVDRRGQQMRRSLEIRS